MDGLSSVEIATKLAGSLRALKTQLQDWHSESQENQKKINELTRKINELEKSSSISDSVKKEIDSVKDKIEGLHNIEDDFFGMKTELSKIKFMQQELSKVSDDTKNNLDTVSDLKNRVRELSKQSDLSDDQLEVEVEKIKSALADVAQKTGKFDELKESFEKYGKDFLSTVDSELAEWKKEIRANDVELKQIKKQLNELSKQTASNKSMAKEVREIKDKMEHIADNTNNFNNLRQILVKHGEEFDDLYSSLGKGKIELEKVNTVVQNLKQNISGWTDENKVTQQQVKELKSELQSINSELKSKQKNEANALNKVVDLGEQVDEVIRKMDSIQRREQELESSQQDFESFSEEMKDLIRKAVIASISKQELEEQLSKMGKKKKPALPLKTKKPKKDIAKELAEEDLLIQPPKKDVKDKLRMLRESLEKPKQEEVESHDLMIIVSNLENDLNTDSPDLVWSNYANEVINEVSSQLNKEKERVKKLKDSGKDVSKISPLLMRKEVGLLSLKAGFAAKDLEKVKNMVGKVVEQTKLIESQLT